MSPENWFEPHKEGETHVWCPAPAAAEVVQEELGKSRQMRPGALHIVLLPRLRTGRWRRHLTRNMDVYFKVEESPWNVKNQFEPLLCFIAFPFVPHKPNLHLRHRLVEDFRNKMCGQDVRAKGQSVQWTSLRKLLVRVWSISGVQKRVVSRVLPLRFNNGFQGLPGRGRGRRGY